MWTLYHSYCFDFSVWEMYGALLYGGKLVIVPLMTARDPEQMVQLLRQERVTVLNQTPSAFYALSQREMDEADAGLCVRTVIFGGEALAPRQLWAWRRKYPNTDLVNMYGITETTVHVTYRKLGDVEIASGINNIGKPLPTLSAYVFGEGQQLQPIGIAGELCIAGDGLARGYLNRPELTAEKFIDNPFNPGTRMYRTGDLARWQPDGNLEYLGRIDQQVKIRGYRIECGEIEAQLLTHVHIREAVVVDRKDEQGQAYLCAYFVSDEVIPVPELRAYLAVQLPDYMIPSYFVKLGTIPITTNGKLDRKALPVPEAAHTGIVYEAPSTPGQQQLAGVWQDVLEVKQIGIHDNFFVLGGDSIKAIRLISRINREMEADLLLKELYLRQTIAELAELLGQERKPNRQLEQGHEMLAQMKWRIMDDPEQAKHLPGSWEDVYPLSKIQQSMVFYSRLRPEEPIYYDQFIFQLKIESPARFAEALQRLSDKHPILRTTFDLTHFEEEVQIVHDRIAPVLSIEDVSSHHQKEQESIIRRYIEQDQRNLFRFDGEVLWRVHLFRLNAQHDYGMVSTFHHAILDGWSVASFRQEAGDIYQQLLQGKWSEGKPLQSTYKDYVAINRFRESDEESRQYWINKMAGYTRNKLPFNYESKKKERGAASKIYRRQLKSTLLGSLKRQAKLYGCTVKELCLSAHVYLLGILTTDEEVVTGVVSHDRPAIEDADKVLGCFVNTVPIRMEVTRQVVKRELVNRTKQELKQMKAHELVLVDIADAIGEVSGLSVNPIFDTMFNYTDFHVLKEMRPGHELVSETALNLEANEMTNTLLDLEVSQTHQNLNMQIKYASIYFDDREIEMAFNWYERILEALCNEEMEYLSMEHLMTARERQAMLYERNLTAIPYETEKMLHQLFEAQVSKTPDAVGVVYGEQQLTYKELNARANQLAWTLREQGVGPECIVAIMAERSLELMVGLYGILKAGGAYLPIDPSLPAERIGYMLRDSGAVVLLLEPGLDPCGFEGAVVELALEGQTQSESNPPLEQNSGSLAYVIYTSGTTGKPKGVMIEHRSVINRLQWMQNRYPIGEQDVILQKTPITFDVSVWELFWWGMTGARVCMLTPQGEKDPAVLAETIEQHGVTVMHFVPSMLSVFLEQAGQVFHQEKLGSLRQVFASGEALKPQHVTGFYKLMEGSGATLHNLYGPTEATVDVTYYDSTSTFAEVAVPIGKPIANTQLYIVDGKRQLQPMCVAGELCIGGDGLARGYVNQPELTAEKFVDNPFRPGTKMYRTGDLARWLPDGNLEYLGRMDQQVKIRGYRIECGEIESQLLAHAHIREVVVMDRKDEQDEAYLCAYLVSDETVPVAELREHLAAQLPDYMIPSHFVELEIIPLNLNGKVDRKALPIPDGEAYTAAYEAPRDALETHLAELFAEVLGVNEVGIGDSFFERGGHSLKAVTLVSRIHQQLAVELPLRELFARPTVKALADYVRNLDESDYGRIEPAVAQASYPLSSAQRRLYVLHEVDPASTRYNMPGVVELAGKVDADRLEQAIHSVITRHESLR
ncbi:amino acid adenylation domain-containing protein, partial [Paenibacillus amylolyticus]|uniref:amino acid adenylation domain-containing protein n=1 Tax=Paenibacillus amylolyticus TaxID=1451 RepID=UPI00324263CD